MTISKQTAQPVSVDAAPQNSDLYPLCQVGCTPSRYIGQEKTHLQHIATAAAMNLVRSLAWESGIPRAQTRRSAFTRLYDVA